MRNLLFFLALGCIVLLSFFLYSFNFSPAFNADGAVNVLMTYYFQLPRDLYYWGQDRWGSLIPLIGQFFYHVCNLSPVTSVSCTNYFFLIVGYAGIFTLFKTNFSRIVFAVIWFLPPFRFMDILWYASGVQYSLIAISIFFVNKLSYEGGVERRLRNHLLLMIVILLWVLSVWVSDASLTTIFILLAVIIFFDRREIKIRKEIAFYLAAGLLAGTFFIIYAKSHVIYKTEDYLKLNDFKTILESMRVIKNSFVDLLAFRVNELFMGIYTWLVILLFAGTALLVLKNKITLRGHQSKWLIFFLIEGISVCVIALLSRWVFLNGVNRRYFFGAYISFSIVLLMIIERLQLDKKILNPLRYSVVIIVLMGATSTVHYLKYVWPKSLRPQYEIFSEFKQLGSFGVISDYWHSYITACVDPEKIKAIPNDLEFVRNPDLIRGVFAEPFLYLIRDDWMDSFPDTLKQFGHVLVKAGEPFKMGGCDVSKYRKLN